MKRFSTITLGFALLLCLNLAPTASATNFDQAKYALVGARNLIPDMQISYTCLRLYEPHPDRANIQREKALSSLSPNHITIPIEKYYLLIQEILDNDINHDGSTMQEYNMTAFLSGEKLKTIQKADYGPIALFGSHRILITDGQTVSDGYWLGQFIWSFSDHIRTPNTYSDLRGFDSALYSPSLFGYKPGEILKENRTIRNIEFNEDQPDTALVTMNGPEGELDGYFEIDLTKGLIARRGLFYLKPEKVETYTFIQYELHFIQEIREGFYFPRSATILKRHRNSERSLPSDFIDNPQPSASDKVQIITFDRIRIIDDGISDEEFIAPVNAGDIVQDTRAAVFELANEGIFPHDLFFEDWVMEAMLNEKERLGTFPGLAEGIAGPEYDYLKLP